MQLRNLLDAELMPSTSERETATCATEEHTAIIDTDYVRVVPAFSLTLRFATSPQSRLDVLLKELWRSYDPEHRRNIGIYIFGIKMYKFGL
ncbi:hypothetical protein P389DRAFT_191737 [Cystobasidium minutum MCA 4210]|uniref:uncharacterized protein n=1 Tax=Cystobasidium minutum MCA 4210 TaxID=1397322 RepID=UPI0034CF0FAC|eukprot:jgi/Rhomi1/191737/estExt_fgenesh1_pg.C_120003